LFFAGTLAAAIAWGCGGDSADEVTGRAVALSPAGPPADSRTEPARSVVVEDLGKRGTQLVVVDLTDGRRRTLARSTDVRGGDVGLAAPAFSPDGARVAVARRSQAKDGRQVTVVLVVPVGGGSGPRQVPNVRLVDAEGYRPAWTPDGRSIAVSRDDGRGTDLVDVRSGRRHVLLSQVARELAFAPDGKAYTFDGAGDIMRARAAGGAARRIAADARAAAWSPDAGRIAYLSWRDRAGEVAVSEGSPRPASEIYVADGDGGHPRRLTRTTADESGPLRWTLDGRAIVFSRYLSGRITARALDPATGCDAPLRMPAAAQPPRGDVSDWDLHALASVVTPGC
jgi:Tol biopolymer transport system component